MEVTGTQNYRKLSSRIDQIVTAVQSFKKEKQPLPPLREKSKLPRIKVMSSKQLSPEKTSKAKPEFLDKLYLFCDSEIIPRVRSKKALLRPRFKSKQITRQKMAQCNCVKTPPPQIILNLRVRKLLDSPIDPVIRSKSTKLLVNKFKRLPLEGQGQVEMPEDEQNQISPVEVPVIPMKGSRSEYKFRVQSMSVKLQRLTSKKEIEARASKQLEEISGWGGY